MTTWVNGHVILWIKLLQPEPPPSQDRKPYAMQRRGYYVLNFSRDLTRLHSPRVMWLHQWYSVTISHYTATFGGKKPYRKWNINFSILHVTSCDNINRESCHVIVSFTSSYFSTLPSLVAIRLLEKKIFNFWFVTWSHMNSWSDIHVPL